MTRNDPNQAWILIAVGAVFLLGGVICLITGQTSQSVRRWGLPINYTIHRDRNPFQFWFSVLPMLAIGAGMLLYGGKLVWKERVGGKQTPIIVNQPGRR